MKMEKLIMPFEEELKKALTRQEPSGDFTKRVLAQCAGYEKSSTLAWMRGFMAWRIAAVTASLFVLTGVGIYREHEQRGEAAKRQLLLAMQIAGQQLHGAQRRVMEFDHKFDNKEVTQ
jgi:hypothetical protein